MANVTREAVPQSLGWCHSFLLKVKTDLGVAVASGGELLDASAV